MVLLLLAGVLAITVAVQVSRLAAAADASAETSSLDGTPYMIYGTIRTPLQPGAAAAAIDVNFDGASGRDRGVRVSRLAVLVTSVTGANGKGDTACSPDDFELSQFSGSYPFSVPSGRSSLSSLGFDERDWPTLRLRNTGSNQDGCSGATVILSYRGTP